MTTAHTAKLSTSSRLKRVDKLLSDGREYSTREIIAHADVCAVNSVITELRHNGRNITCRREGQHWYYTMEQAK